VKRTFFEQLVMNLYQLTQDQHSDFTTPDRVNTMLVFAESKEQARAIAEKSELEHRDGEQIWTADHAKCDLIDIDTADAGVLLTS
jgi:hypothetical protein